MRRVTHLLIAVNAIVWHAQAFACDSAFAKQRLDQLAKGHLVDHATLHGGKTGAGPFPRFGVELLARVPLSDFPGNPGAGTDIWGYVSPSGREYAIMGLRNGTAFVEVTDPRNPVIVGHVPHINACCSDAEVYNDHCYIVSEGSNIGMKIIDLRDIDNGVIAEVATYTGAGLRQAHNIAINQESGFAYICGALNNPSLGGLIVVNIANPANPILAGIWSGQYVHDAEVVNYTSGPYAGKEIAFACSGFGTTALRVIDVTNKANMLLIGACEYPDAEFAHQANLSEDRKYVFLNDEFDEIDNGTTTSTHVIDVRDLRNPTYVRSFGNGLNSTDHNLNVKGQYIYEANYTSGLRIYRAQGVGNIREVGYFDTYPHNDIVGFAGAWGVYAHLPSGTILLSDIQYGLFLLDASEATTPPAASAVHRYGIATIVAVIIGLALGGYTVLGSTRAGSKVRMTLAAKTRSSSS